MKIRMPAAEETNTLVELADATQIFKPGEAASLLTPTLEAFHSGNLGLGHQIFVLDDSESGAPAAWAYFAPSQYAQGVWDIWWIGAHPNFYGKNFGKSLLLEIELEIKKLSGRVIIIETSSAPALERARRFYERMGYGNRGRIPDFYGKGDDKITFSKSI